MHRFWGECVIAKTIDFLDWSSFLVSHMCTLKTHSVEIYGIKMSVAVCDSAYSMFLMVHSGLTWGLRFGRNHGQPLWGGREGTCDLWTSLKLLPAHCQSIQDTTSQCVLCKKKKMIIQYVTIDMHCLALCNIMSVKFPHTRIKLTSLLSTPPLFSIPVQIFCSPNYFFF